MMNLVLRLQEYTTPANTIVVTDSAAPPGSLPKPVVQTPAAILSPLIDGNGAYIWSPNATSNQSIMLRSTFHIGAISSVQPLTLHVTYAFAANDTISVTGHLEVINLLGNVISSLSLFTADNTQDSQDVAIATGDVALEPEQLAGNYIRIVIVANISSPIVIGLSPNKGRHLGQLTVRENEQKLTHS